MTTRTARRAGFTLIELLVVVAVLGLVLLFAGPRFRQFQEQTNLRNGVNAVSALYGQARAVAVTRGMESRLMLTADSAWIMVQTPTGPQLAGSIEPLAERYGVTLGGVDSIRIGSTGIPIGIATRAPITVSKNSKVDSIHISRYGRIE